MIPMIPAILLAAAAPAAPPASAAWWRIYVVQKDTDTYWAIRQANFYDSTGTLIPTTGGTAFEGGAGSQGAHGAAAAFDNNAGTYCARNANASWVGYHWASAKAPTRVDITINDATRGLIRWKLQYSLDTTNGTDGTWTDTLVVWEESWDAAGATRTAPQDTSGGKYKAYRLNVTASNDASFTLIQEMELHATIGGADICNGGRATGSQANVNEDPGKAFDNVDGNNYDLHIPVTGWLMYVLPTPATIAEYMIRCNNTNSRTPKDWTLEGTNDGVTFTALNSQATQSWVVPQNKTFAI